MKMKEFIYTPYEIALRSPIHTALGDIRFRCGYLLAAHGMNGAIGIGEVALPIGEHTGKSHPAEVDLDKVAQRCYDIEIPENPWRYAEFHTQVSPLMPLRPEVIWGVDCALWGLYQATDQESWVGPIKPFESTRQFSVNTLISEDSIDKIFEAAQRERERGFRTIKLKVGVLPLEEEIRVVRRIRLQMPEIRLRLDANRAWSTDEAVEFCTKVEAFGIEYIEDPLADLFLDELSVLRECSHIRIAIDESWPVESIFEGKVDWSLCDALIIKPDRVGSMFHVQSLYVLAREQGKDVVFTGIYNSSLGIAAALDFLKHYADESISHGYGTANLLASDTLSIRMQASDGMLPIVNTAQLSRLVAQPYRARLGIPDEPE